MRRAATQKAPKVTAKSYTKDYLRLLTQATGSSVKKIDEYFFGEDGEDSELRPWYYCTTALYVAIGLFVFVAIN